MTRPQLKPPRCGRPRCIALCVCSTALVWSHFLAQPVASRDEDDDVRDDDDDTEVEAGDEEHGVSLWDVLDTLDDYSSEQDDEYYRHGIEESLPPSPPMALPPRKLRYSQRVALEEDERRAKRSRFDLAPQRLGSVCVSAW